MKRPSKTSPPASPLLQHPSIRSLLMHGPAGAMVSVDVLVRAHIRALEAELALAKARHVIRDQRLIIQHERGLREKAERSRVTILGAKVKRGGR